MKMTNKTSFMAIVLCILCTMIHAQVKLLKSDLIKFDFNQLANNKSKIQHKDAALMPAYNQLIKDADKSLEFKPVSVMDKKDFPPSGNKHDYMSIAPYWWPDTAKPNGLPYIKKDGEVNPEVANYPDKENFPKVIRNIYTLSLAYYFSGEEKYAAHASKLIQVWYLDTATRMNPNLNFGQAVKGVITGRAEGIIDTRHFVYLIDAVEILKGSKSWTTQHQTTLKQWFSEFLSWLQNSKIGIKEMKAKNNHGVWYDAQTLAIALYIDSTDLANKTVNNVLTRLDKQMDEKGLFPLELERTTSLHYSVFIMNAFEIVAQLSEKTKTNLWTAKTSSGKTFKQAFDAIYPFLTDKKKWEYKQITEYDYADGINLLLRADSRFNCITCIEDIKYIAKQNYIIQLFNLL